MFHKNHYTVYLRSRTRTEKILQELSRTRVNNKYFNMGTTLDISLQHFDDDSLLAKRSATTVQSIIEIGPFATVVADFHW